MQQNDEKLLSRREFLRMAATVAGGVAVAGAGFVACHQSPSRDIPRLNPAFRIRELSGEEIELYTHQGDGTVLKHRFAGLEADLFREIEKEQPIDLLVDGLARRHHLPVAQCRDRINASLREFEAARLVYYGPPMLVKVVEVKNG